MPDPIRLLTFTTLYPNSVNPRHGIFVETRLRQLLDSGDIQARVMAPVPWFPFTQGPFGTWGRLARIPLHETRHGIEVAHPRYPLLPRVGMNLAPLAIALRTLPLLRRQIREGRDFDLIDAHYFYPDGVAAALLGRWLDKPVVITARGSDINVLPGYVLPRKMILWAAQQADACITVSQSLRDRLVALGTSPDHISVLRNGVDLALFHPRDRHFLRHQLNLAGHVLLSVGNLVPLKGNHLTIEALERLPDTHLVVVGEGPEKPRLRELAERLGLGQRVHFLGDIPQNELPLYYSGADALILASSREGWANVLLEAMACGTPVVATDVGGNREVVAAPEAGVLMSERTPEALRHAVLNLFNALPSRQDTRQYAERFGWQETSLGQKNLFRQVLSAGKGRAAP